MAAAFTMAIPFVIIGLLAWCLAGVDTRQCTCSEDTECDVCFGARQI